MPERRVLGSTEPIMPPTPEDDLDLSQALVLPKPKDVRDIVQRLTKDLTDRATTYHATGWVDDPDGVTFDLVNGVVVARLIMERAF